MEKIKKIFDFKHLESDIIHRIIAVVVAIVIWVVLSITQYPTTTLKISNIPVIFNMEGTIAEQEGLRAVGFQNITTTVEIKGMKYEIGGYTEKDLIATVNLDNVTKEGTYSLNIEAESVHTSDQCEILSCYPETIDVTFEHFGEQSFNVEAEAPNVTAEDDSFVAKTSVSPAKVVVTGSDENLKKIKRVAAITKEEKIISDDITISTSDLVFYDENDNIISSTNFTVDNQNFDIAFSLYKNNEVKLNVDFEDCPPGFNISSLPYSLSPEKVNIINSNLNDKITAKTVGTISLSDVDLTKSFEFDIPLEKSEEIYKSENAVRVIFDNNGYSSKNITIKQDDIKITNKPAGKTVKVTSPSSVMIAMCGPESIISQLESSDLTAIIDLNNTTKTGSFDKKITVYSKEFDTVWCFGEYVATLTIS